MRVGILGAGSWGIAQAVMLHHRGHEVTMWEFSASDVRMLNEKREHPRKLPGIKIPDEITITNDASQTIIGRDYVVGVMPSQATRAALKGIVKGVSPEDIAAVRAWIIASKGIECETLKLMTDVYAEELPGLDTNKLVVLSGPSHAEEVSREIPTTIVAACGSLDLATEIQDQFSTEYFRIYTNDDVVGVELSASIKNVIALAAGICDGLGFGDNTKGALLTRGMVEMIRLGKTYGAHEATFSGLAGFGDLITTCISRHSRNRNMGELIAKGVSLNQANEQLGMVAEGVETTRSLYELARQKGVDMPITTEVYRTLFEGKSPHKAVRDLMTREQKREKLG